MDNQTQVNIGSPQAYGAVTGDTTSAPPSFSGSHISGDYALSALKQATALHTRVTQNSPQTPLSSTPSDTITVPASQFSRWRVIDKGQQQENQPVGRNANQEVAGNIVSGATTGLKDLAIGAAKGAGRIGVGLGVLGGKLLEQVYGKDSVARSTPASVPGTPEYNRTMNSLQDSNNMQAVGDWGTQIAAFFIPGADVAGAESAVGEATANLPTFARAAARIFGDSAIEAGQGALGGYIESGGDPQAAKTGALTFGLTKGATTAIGEGLRASGVPMRLYSRIFSNTADDLVSAWKGQAADAIKSNNPSLFDEMMKNGAVSVGENGTVDVNKSVAQHMLETNVKGSASQMGKLVATRLFKNENDVQNIIGNIIQKSPDTAVEITYPDNMVNVLRTTAGKMQNVADNKYSNLANELADKIESSTRAEGGQFKSNTGRLTPNDALTLRRFLDAMRTESSFDKSLLEVGATGQKNYKFLSDKVRTSLVSALPDLESVMKDYSYNIRGLEQLASSASRKEHEALFGMWDALIFDTGLSGGGLGLGALAGLGRRAADMPAVYTTGAQMMQNGVQTALGKIIKGGLTAIQNTPSPSGQ